LGEVTAQVGQPSAFPRTSKLHPINPTADNLEGRLPPFGQARPLAGAILIRVLRPGLFPQECTCDLRDDVPLETVANRSTPMAYGPNLDQAARRPTFVLSAIAALRGWAYRSVVR
jgi:hypothetical protein